MQPILTLLILCATWSAWANANFKLLPKTEVAAISRPRKVPDFSQPAKFDPQDGKWKRYRHRGYWQYCQTPDCEAPQMEKNHENRKNSDRIELPPPFELDFFEFNSGSTFDYVIEIRKAGIRQALYPKVEQFAHGKGREAGVLLLNHWKKKENGWTPALTFVDIAANTETELPQAHCTERIGAFFGENLLTYSDKNLGPTTKNYETEICVWDAQATLVARAKAPLRWGAFSQYGLTDTLGVAKGALYALTQPEKKQCVLVIQDLKDESKHTEIRLSTIRACASSELDWSGFDWQNRSLKYRKSSGEWVVN